MASVARIPPKQTVWQAILIVTVFVLLSVPLGLALKRIAQQSQVQLTVRNTLQQAVAAANGRISALRVEANDEGIGVDAVIMVPHHVSSLEATLQGQLEAQLGRQAVVLHIREVLTSDDASFARQQGTLAELQRSVLALQDAENLRLQRQQAAQDARMQMVQALLPYLGRLNAARTGPAGSSGWRPMPASRCFVRSGSNATWPRCGKTPPRRWS